MVASAALALVSDGARWTLAVVFGLAILEKALTLHAHTEAWNPVVVALEPLRKHARLVMAGSLMADISGVALLLVRPRVGALEVVLLVSLYTAAGMRMHMDSAARECRCFWRVLNTSTRSSLLARNALFIALGTMVGFQGATTSLASLLWTVVLVGAAVTVTGALEARQPLADVSRVASGHAMEGGSKSEGRSAAALEVQRRR